MAGKKLKNGTEEWMMFVDFWQMCQDFWVAENSDEYWNALINSANEFADKYKGIIPGNLSEKLALAFSESKELERQNKYRE